MEQVNGSGVRRLARGPGRWRARLLASVILLLAGGLPAAGEPIEYQVKAAFLLNFTKFIEWPAAAFATADSPIEICVLGDDPFGGALDQIAGGEVVNGRRIAARRIDRAPPPKSCAVLFVGRSPKESIRVLPGLGAGVLTVGEGETFIREGGMIAFVLENRRVRFAINAAAAERAGLKLSSKLLSVAKSVE